MTKKDSTKNIHNKKKPKNTLHTKGVNIKLMNRILTIKKCCVNVWANNSFLNIKFLKYNLLSSHRVVNSFFYEACNALLLHFWVRYLKGALSL